jgi:hypothetical protein
MLKPKTPENRGKARLKYDFDNMTLYTQFPVSGPKEATRWCAAATRRGYRVSRYTNMNTGKMYVMFFGKRK